VRAKQSRRVRKGVSAGGIGTSRWKLKSPVIKSSDGRVMRFSRRVEKSDMKLAFEDEGGR
jgi:hypothetical protein